MSAAASAARCLWDHQILAAAAAKLAGRPVRMVLSREGVFRIVGGRTTTEQRVALGAKADGTLAALIHTGVAAMTAHNACPEQFTFPARHLYAADAIKVAQEVADMDMLANTFMRAPGESIGTFALECAIDELAEAMRHRSDRAAPPHRAGEGPDLGPALLLAQHRRGLPARRGAVRLGAAQPGAAARAARASG